MFCFVCLCTGVCRVSLFKCLSLATAHFPVSSKTIYGERKGWVEKPFICANSEGFINIGLKKRNL